jgi:hypothetical protein
MRRSLIVVVLAYMLLGRGEATISYGSTPTVSDNFNKKSLFNTLVTQKKCPDPGGLHGWLRPCSYAVMGPDVLCSVKKVT